MVAVQAVWDVVRDISEDELLAADVVVFNPSDSKLQCQVIPTFQFFLIVLRRRKKSYGVQSNLKINWLGDVFI